jgi:hypothetical protein
MFSESEELRASVIEFPCLKLGELAKIAAKPHTVYGKPQVNLRLAANAVLRLSLESNGAAGVRKVVKLPRTIRTTWFGDELTGDAKSDYRRPSPT